MWIFGLDLVQKGIFGFRQKKWLKFKIQYIRISLKTKIYCEDFNFLDQICPEKGIYQYEHYLWFLDQTYAKLVCISVPKWQKWISLSNSAYSNYSSLNKSNFILNRQFYFLNKIYPKRVIPVENRKIKHHH